LGPPQFNAQGSRIGGGIGCAGCHRPPEFDIDPASRSNGLLTSIGGGLDLTNTRSPSLRDLVDSTGAVYTGLMHDGSFSSLNAVLVHYNAIPVAAAAPGNAPSVDPRILPGGNPQRLNLTTQETEDVVAFLRTLSGTAMHTDPRWSDPFDLAGNLDIVGLNAAVQGWMFY
jgi:cytochrome c peroxidase